MQEKSLTPEGVSYSAKRMLYQLGWATLPGLRGLSVSEFRATPTTTPDNERGVAVNFASDADRNEFLRRIEAEFASRRFTNTADAFDTVKAYVLTRAAKRQALLVGAQHAGPLQSQHKDTLSS